MPRGTFTQYTSPIFNGALHRSLQDIMTRKQIKSLAKQVLAMSLSLKKFELDQVSKIVQTKILTRRPIYVTPVMY